MNLRGFTLVELVIYLGLLSFLLSGAVLSAYAVLGAAARGTEGAQLTEEGNFVLGKIGYLMGSASAATVAPDSLMIFTPNGAAHTIALQGKSLFLDGSMLTDLALLVLQASTTPLFVYVASTSDQGAYVSATFVLQTRSGASRDFSGVFFLENL